MGYKENAVYYRHKFAHALKNNDLTNAKIYVVYYYKLLRDMEGLVTKYTDRATLIQEAERYEGYARTLRDDGITKRLKDAVAAARPINAPEPAPVAVAAPPTTVTAPPIAPANNIPTPKTTRTTKSAPYAPTFTPVTPPVQPVALPVQPVQPIAPPASLTHSPDVEWSADMFERYKGATVEIQSVKGVYVSSGTGFFINDSGYLLTNHHVAYDSSGTKRTNLDIKSGDKKIVTKAEVLHADKVLDVALLKIKDTKVKTPYIPLVKDSATVRAGIDVMIIGNGLSWGLAPVTGTLKFPKHENGDMIYTAQTNGGDSGSPLINRNGECVGIHKARITENGGGGARGIACATSTEDIKKLLKKWKMQI